MTTIAGAGIRGPELYEDSAIAALIAEQHHEAVQHYAHGLATVIRVWKLLAARQRLTTLSTERAFLIHQLETLEARDPQAVAAALARQRSVPEAAPDTRDEPDVLHEALRSIEELLT